jgi:hypothetical protein
MAKYSEKEQLELSIDDMNQTQILLEQDAWFLDVLGTADLMRCITRMQNGSCHSKISGDFAVKHGYLGLMKYKQGTFSYTPWAMAYAATAGSLDIVQWLCENTKLNLPPITNVTARACWNTKTPCTFKLGNILYNLSWLDDNNCIPWLRAKEEEDSDAKRDSNPAQSFLNMDVYCKLVQLPLSVSVS